MESREQEPKLYNFKDVESISLVTSVPDRLANLGNLYKERNALYKDNYKHFGTVLKGLFPRGITIESEEEHNRYAIFLQIVHKTSRYANAIKIGGHKDSLDDISVYSQMLAEYDQEIEHSRDEDELYKKQQEIEGLNKKLEAAEKQVKASKANETRLRNKLKEAK